MGNDQKQERHGRSAADDMKSLKSTIIEIPDNCVNQRACYAAALDAGANPVSMSHPYFEDSPIPVGPMAGMTANLYFSPLPIERLNEPVSQALKEVQ
jgi:hypothetical protein